MSRITITLTIDVPEGTAVAVHNGSEELPTLATVRPVSAAEQPSCPKHGPAKVKPSKFGGFYCQAADDSEVKGYCTWKQK